MRKEYWSKTCSIFSFYVMSSFVFDPKGRLDWLDFSVQLLMRFLFVSLSLSLSLSFSPCLSLSLSLVLLCPSHSLFVSLSRSLFVSRSLSLSLSLSLSRSLSLISLFSLPRSRSLAPSLFGFSQKYQNLNRIDR